MIIKGRARLILVMIIMTIFLFQNCATITKGTSQKIPVTSNPIGAKIIVDGEEAGNTPLTLKLKRKKDHVIRIEKQDYNSLEIRITRRSSPAASILGNIFWGLLGSIPGGLIAWGGAIGGIFGGEEAEDIVNTGNIVALIGFIAGWGVGILVDSSSGANSTLSPNVLDVTLTKSEGKPHPAVLNIDSEQVQNLKWIRIRFSNNDGENENISLDYID